MLNIIILILVFMAGNLCGAYVIGVMGKPEYTKNEVAEICEWYEEQLKKARSDWNDLE